ncbi:DNA methyltransferase [Dolosigranulum pigrum]|jgi:DNA methylase N-4/N-6
MKNKNYAKLKSLLKTEKKYISENGELLKAKLYSDAHNMDESLLELLLSDDAVKELFFTEVSGLLIFDKKSFQELINSHDFLPNSYTTYSNKIGLTVNNEFISNQHDVVLDFPYKDSVLPGGQSKENKKRQEIFYHEKLAHDEIKRLIDPKVLTNAKRFTQGGEEKDIDFKEDDNLIIKGNNLVALHSLKKRYGGKVKLIYIDPPYNTGNDSFKYNDKFNRSSWLVFMKNRLEVAKELLASDGAIYINIDYNEVHYLKILMDEIFGENNFQREIIWRIGWVSGYKTKVSNYVRNHDTILFYSKSNSMDFKKNYIKNSDFKPLVKKKDEIKEKFNDMNLSKDIQDQILDVINYKSRPEKYPLEDVWNANEYDDLNSIAIVSYSGESVSKMLNTKDIKGQKSEKLIQRIISAHTDPGDLVLDFFMGTGTTQAVAHKMQRQYIGIEQMDYIKDISVERLKKVIIGEGSGISKNVNWKGGGSFVYCELKENANELIKLIQNADNNTINKIKEMIYSDERIISCVTKEELKTADMDFEDLPIEDQKELLMKLVNKNKLYVNYSEIEDKTYDINDSDKRFSKSFYEVN